MDNIITPSESFDFSTIMLENPAPLHGGSFFTKLKFLDKGIPLYVQFPKCLSKNGFVKNNTSKRGYIDLQFNYFETDILTWMENLEEKCRQLIYEKRELWFQTEMLEEDIENMFISPIKPFRSGKFLIVRTYIPTSKHIKQEGCLIYDENERLLDINSIKDTTQFIPLVHIEGIKFSSKSFQIEINVRQIMVISLEDDIKKNCLIKNKLNNSLIENTKSLENNKPEDLENNKPEDLENNTNKFSKNSTLNNLENNKPETLEVSDSNKILETKYNNNLDSNKLDDNILDGNNLDDNILDGNNLDDNNLHEINLDIHAISDNDEISLKKPKEVYYEIYKAAYSKARQYKKAAIEAHLEANKIKSKYSLDDMLNSDEELGDFSEIEE